MTLCFLLLEIVCLLNFIFVDRNPQWYIAAGVFAVAYAIMERER